MEKAIEMNRKRLRKVNLNGKKDQIKQKLLMDKVLKND